MGRVDIQHGRTVQRLVNNLIKDGCPPSQISISAKQNPQLEDWAKRKGVVFSKTQAYDIRHPDSYSMETKNHLPPFRNAVARLRNAIGS
jgi:hypothetical protein